MGQVLIRPLEHATKPNIEAGGGVIAVPSGKPLFGHATMHEGELFGYLMFMSNGSYPLYVYCSLLYVSFMDLALNKYF